MRFDMTMAHQMTQNHAVMFDPDRGWALNTHKRYPAELESYVRGARQAEEDRAQE